MQFTDKQKDMLQVAYLSRTTCKPKDETTDAKRALVELEGAGLITLSLVRLEFEITPEGVEFVEANGL